MHRTFAALGSALALTAVVASAQQGPDALLNSLAPRGYVSDFAGVFASNDVVSLQRYLAEVQQRTTAEIAVVTVRTLDGGEVSDFAVRLFAKWGVGKKDKDNGVLLLAAIADRKCRIEVGYGLEGLINDARAGRVLDEQVIPRFREERYAAGLADGARTLAAIIAANAGVTLSNTVGDVQGVVPVAAPAVPATPGQTKSSGGLGALIVLGILGGIVALLVIAAKKGWIKPSSGKPGGGSSGGSSSRGSSSSGGGFGGGRSGGGGASRGW